MKFFKNLIEHFKSFWKGFWDGAVNHPWRFVGGLVGGLIVLAVFCRVFYWAYWADISPEWTGFGEWKELIVFGEDDLGNEIMGTEFQRTKTLWDWMDLLLVPILLVLGAWWLDKREKSEQDAIARLEREISKDKRQQEALDAYLSRMSTLILDYSVPLHSDAKVFVPNAEAAIFNIAISQTVAVLRVLDGKRKGQVLEFLYRSGFIMETGSSIPKLNLERAEFRRIDLIVGRPEDISSNTQKADWDDSLLREYVDEYNNQPMWRVYLQGVSLIYTDLYRAAFVLTNLTDADFSRAYLMNAYLHGAFLTGARFIEANLSGAILYRADCIGADFRKATLSGAKFEGAYLHHANFLNTDLSQVSFTGALYNERTVWPDEFDPKAAGAIFQETLKYQIEANEDPGEKQK